ncbi:amino acid adenylation domain-containing protein [Streptomyces sp. NPDC017936]|uniref:amino acid adenylation domain-containing protein n=1 Tax=Streptomyces sp. NPDC017936 TaxID=3365016 RepID=UPI0037ADAC14
MSTGYFFIASHPWKIPQKFADAGVCGRRTYSVFNSRGRMNAAGNGEKQRSMTLSSRAIRHAQQQGWFLANAGIGTTIAHAPAMIRLNGPLETVFEDALRTALSTDPRLVRRLTVVDGRLVDGGAKSASVPVDHHDLTGLPASKRSAHLTELIEEMVRTPFVPTTDPPARARLITTDDKEHVVLLVLHRTAGDVRLAEALLADALHTYGRMIAGETAIRDGAGHTEDPFPTHPDPDAEEPAAEPDALPPAPALPFSRPTPAQRTFAAESVPVELPTEVVAALRRLGSGHGVDPTLVVLALFLLLLHRYSGEARLATAVPAGLTPEGPGNPDAGGMTTALLCEIDGDLTFHELLDRVRNALLRPVGTAPMDILTRPAFTARHVPPITTPDGLRARFLPVEAGTTPGDLSLHLVWDGDHLSGRLEFATEVLDRSTAERAVGHLSVLLAGAIAHPAAPVSALPLLTLAEEETVGTLNGVAAETPELTFHQLFEKQAEKTPDAIAVRSHQASLIYRDLNEHANRLARILRGHGIGPERTVAICMDRSVRLIVAVLAVLKAGGAYVPVDPRDPAQRRETILRDAGVRVVVVDGLPADGGTYGDIPVVALDDAWSVLAEAAPDNLPVSPSALADAAYVLYTSGSTGAPKGVVVENRQLISYASGAIRRLGMDAPLKHLMVQPLTVDSTLTALVPPLITGGELHVVSRECALDPELFADWVQQHGVDCLKIAPSHLRALQGSPRFEELLPRRLLVIGGEASEWRWMRDLQHRVPHCRVFNHYGPTETTVGVLTLSVSDHLDADWETAPIGVPLAGTQVYVVDRSDQVVPAGVPGELLISGAYVARGYHNRAELTARAFTTDRFSGRPDGRLYRTGDIVRRLPDGTIEFLGRRDDQIKIRGYRVTLGEIDSALAAHPSVDRALTIVRQDSPGERRVVAYVQPRDRAAFELATLKLYVRKRLSPHMVPQAYVVLDRLPLSAHGKVDRSALPAPVAPTPATGSGGAPRNETERAVAAVWQELLDIESVGAEQSFFDLGGHSLLLVELQHRLRLSVGDISLLDLLQYPTVRSQAAYLSRPADPDQPVPSDRAADVRRNALMKRREQQMRAKRGRGE